MSQIIRTVLFERLKAHEEWKGFARTFRELTGHEVELVEQGGARLREPSIEVRVDMHRTWIGSLCVRDTGSAEWRRACQHLLSLAAERFTSLLSERHVHDHEAMPGAVRETCRWIRDRALDTEVRLGEAAEACGLSASHLSRVFHQSTGMTFQSYVTRFRLEHACGLLRTTKRTVTEIAYDSGFQSISQFHRSFRAVYGQRPLTYRRMKAATDTR